MKKLILLEYGYISVLWMLKSIETIWQNGVGLKDVRLSLYSTYIRLIIIMWWAWTHLYHQWFKHGLCVWMVGSTYASREVNYKQNAFISCLRSLSLFCKYIAFLDNIICNWIYFFVLWSKKSTTVFFWTGWFVFFMNFNWTSLFVLFFKCFKQK